MRKIDSKYHIAGEEILNTSSEAPIPEDEPLFLFRGQDRLVSIVLRFYGWLCQADGCTGGHLESVDDALGRFLAFKRQHPDRMGQPGSTITRQS